MPAGRDFSSEPTPRRKRSRVVGGWLALVVPSIVSVLVLMVALGFLVLFTPVERPASAADRKRIVDIHAVAAQIDDYRPDAGRETFRRHEYFDRSFELDYSYAPGKGDDLAMNSTLTVAATPADAERLFGRRWGLDAAARTLSGGKDLRLIEAQRHLSLGRPIAAGRAHRRRQAGGQSLRGPPRHHGLLLARQRRLFRLAGVLFQPGGADAPGERDLGIWGFRGQGPGARDATARPLALWERGRG